MRGYAPRCKGNHSWNSVPALHECQLTLPFSACAHQWLPARQQVLGF